MERAERDLITNKAKRLPQASVRNVKIFQRKTLTFAHTDNIIKQGRNRKRRHKTVALPTVAEAYMHICFGTAALLIAIEIFTK